MEGLVPLSLHDVWRLLWLHLDEETVRAIHPWINGRVVRDEGQVTYNGLTFPTRHVMEREVRIAGRTLHNTWTYLIAPPASFDYEIVGVEGFRSMIRNAYREEPSGTRIATDAELAIGRLPGFLQRRIAGRLFGRADAEDLAYLRRNGFRRAVELAGPPHGSALPKGT